MTYTNMLDIAKQLAKDTDDRISDFGTTYRFHPDEIVLINESESAQVIAAVTAGITTDFLPVNNGGHSFRRVTQNIINELNTDKSRLFINAGVEVVFDEFKLTNIVFSVNNDALSAIVEVPMLDLYQSGDVLVDYLKLYLLIVAKITKLKVGKLQVNLLNSYILKTDINAIRDIPNNNMVEVVLAETLTDLKFTGDDIILKT